MHAIFTVLTLGLWGISWAALTIGQRIQPWRCDKCGWNEPDFSKVRKRSKGAETEKPPTQAEAKADTAE